MPATVIRTLNTISSLDVAAGVLARLVIAASCFCSSDLGSVQPPDSNVHPRPHKLANDACVQCRLLRSQICHQPADDVW